MRRSARAALLCGIGALAAAAAAPAEKARPVFGSAPFDAPGDRPHRLTVSFDFTAAQQILEALSLEKPKPGDASALLALPAIRRQIEESGKGDARWIEDFNAAFAEESRPSTFDLRSIRLDHDRWALVLASLKQHAERIARLSERRAAALLPPDHAVEGTARVELTFGLHGLADHLVSGARDPHGIAILVDVARALPIAGAGSPEQAEDSFSRLVAAEVFRPAWEIYRSRAAGWRGAPELGAAEPLVKAVATMGPVWLYSYDPNFFPLSEWLRDPMVRATDAFNEEADLLLDPKTDLSKRAELIAALQRRSLQNDIALAAGLFFADAIFQELGPEELSRSLAAGPAAFLTAYDRAASRKSSLPPLSHRVREQLKGRATPRGKDASP